MNIWQYLDNCNRRKHLKKMLNYYKEERIDYSAIVDQIPASHIREYSSLVNAIKEKIKFYESKLNDLL